MSGNTKLTAPRLPTAEIYSINRTHMGTGGIKVSCTGDFRIHSTLINIPTNAIYGDNNSQKAVPTSNPDIAMIIHAALDEDDSVLSNYISNIWPTSTIMANRYSANSEHTLFPFMMVRVRLNFADALPKIPPGLFGSFTGPTLVIYVTPFNAGDTIGTCPAGSERVEGDVTTCMLVSRRITSPGTMLTSGTCEMQIPNKVVYMGQHPGASGQNSRWVDASFDIKCPDAWGYDVKGVGSSNPLNDADAIGKFTRNNPITISVSPYTDAIASLSGAFKLDGNGASGYASGYGIQLAWGSPAEQLNGNTIPAKPVNFSSPSPLNLANSNYITTSYVSGNSAVPAGTDGRVYLSARYIRTADPFQPGLANGKVEVIVSYN